MAEAAAQYDQLSGETTASSGLSQEETHERMSLGTVTGGKMHPRNRIPPIGDPGGGFPGTFTDIGLAVDKLRDLAPTYHLDLERVITVGHSAGGHLGFWVAARHRLPAGHPLRGADTLPLSAAVALAGILNLAESLERDVCIDYAAVLMDGTPDEIPELYVVASPSELLPLGLRQTLIHGTEDPIVPLAMSVHYRNVARAAGDHRVSLKKVQGADHFDVIDPTSPQWPQVFERILEQFE